MTGRHDPNENDRRDEGIAGKHHHRGKSSERLLDKGAILAALAVQPGQTILDAGCGNGYMSKEFSRLAGPTGTVYALDPDEIAIAMLRRETGGSNIEAVVGDITAPTALPAAAFNFIYLSTVVHGFTPEQMRGFATETERLLAPRGRLAIVEIVKRETSFGPPLEIRLSPEDLQAALGLKPATFTEVNEHFYLQVFENEDQN